MSGGDDEARRLLVRNLLAPLPADWPAGKAWPPEPTPEAEVYLVRATAPDGAGRWTQSVHETPEDAWAYVALCARARKADPTVTSYSVAAFARVKP